MLNGDFKSKCILMARKHGASAKIKASRLEAMLKIYSRKDKSRNQLLFKRIVTTGLAVNRHLRHASILGCNIGKMEAKER